MYIFVFYIKIDTDHRFFSHSNMHLYCMLTQKMDHVTLVFIICMKLNLHLHHLYYSQNTTDMQLLCGCKQGFTLCIFRHKTRLK